MSNTPENVQSDGSAAGEPLTLESLQRYLAAQAEDRDWAEERAQGVLARLFKLAIIMVCLNVVIAGANVAMIVLRPRGTPAVIPTAPAAAALPAAPSPVATPSPHVAEPEAPGVVPQLLTPAELPTSPAPAPAEKKAPLLGPLLSPGKPALVAARRPARVQPLAVKAVMPAEIEAELSERPERW